MLAEEEATQSLPRDARLGDSSGKMKQFATWFTHGVVGGAKLRGAIYHRRTGAEVLGLWTSFSGSGLRAMAIPAPTPETMSRNRFLIARWFATKAQTHRSHFYVASLKRRYSVPRCRGKGSPHHKSSPVLPIFTLSL